MFSPLMDCAATGCPHTCRNGGDTWLERISPTGPGKPFIGLCQDHQQRTAVVLRPEAVALLGEGGSGVR